MKRLLIGAVLLSTTGAFAQAPAAPTAPRKPGLTLTTTAFEDGGVIPDKYSQASPAPVSPKLTWTNVPDGTVSFVLIENDPDTALNKTVTEVTHWLMFNIPGATRELPEGVPAEATLPDGSIQGINQAKKVGYLGAGAGAQGPYHHYSWAIFALDTKLTLGPDATQKDVEAAMAGHILGKGYVSGRFHR
jgi:Raf kinase inhibitor-like YbhB/YbcL family protein